MYGKAVQHIYKQQAISHGRLGHLWIWFPGVLSLSPEDAREQPSFEMLCTHPVYKHQVQWHTQTKLSHLDRQPLPTSQYGGTATSLACSVDANE